MAHTKPISAVEAELEVDIELFLAVPAEIKPLLDVGRAIHHLAPRDTTDSRAFIVIPTPVLVFNTAAMHTTDGIGAAWDTASDQHAGRVPTILDSASSRV